MPSCAFRKCCNYSTKKNKTHAFTFHALPKDEFVRQKWIAILRKQRRERDWTPSIYTRVCSIHFRPEDTYKTNKDLMKIAPGAIPCLHLSTTNPKRRRLEEEESQYDPFKEYANDSTDETSDDETLDEIIKYALDTEKVYLKSHKDKEESGLTKRASSDTFEVPLDDYTGELYEFGKYIAKQLMCLNVEEARVAQAEIRALLSKFDINKIMGGMSEPGTSELQPATESHTRVKPSATQLGPKKKQKVTTQPSLTQPVFTPLNTRQAVKQSVLIPVDNESLASQSIYSHVNIFGPSVNQPVSENTCSVIRSGSKINVSGISRARSPALSNFAMLNANSNSSPALPIRYVIVPKASGSEYLTTQIVNTDSLVAQDDSGAVGTTVFQQMPSLVISSGTIMQPEATSTYFEDTSIKIEPECVSSYSHVDFILPNVVETEQSPVNKYEQDSEDET